ncbi:hypothetical protein HEP86_01970 [Streptomyces sp. RPA4-5]|uniref:type I-E CRISPR-associated protein Cse2/CasB n=1 Tax=Streptomyces sp. RPA4-5 TaxID=2721245 RepID=UPI00143EEF99|nr:type I-E CRISPR-associated protein Cse2/CasB [Streptomyces sp. RPA4-5]QIY53488.1 hypothetical protein HEP86_01970 [Streptomyces sp. RPA4-5]
MTTPTPANGSGLGRYTAFMNHVRRLCTTPEGRVDLRTGLLNGIGEHHADTTSEHGHGDLWRMYMRITTGNYTIPIPDQTPPARRRTAEEPYLLAATLYATYDAPNPKRTDTPAPLKREPDAQPWQNLGWTLRTATALRPDTARGILTSLCECDYTDLLTELPATVSLLRSGGATIRYPVLIRDVVRWQRWPDDVRIEWARSYTTKQNGNKENTK